MNRARSPMTKISGCPGIERSGSTGTRPARSSGDAERAGERGGADAGVQRTVSAAIRSPPTTRRRRAPIVGHGRRRSGPRRPAARAPPAPSRESSVGKRREDARPRLDQDDRARPAGRSRGSRTTSTCRAISAIAPASSTPVGPPPTRTKVSSARRRAGSVSRSALLEGEQDPAADLEGVLERLQPRRVRLPFVVAEVGVARAGREDEVVVRQAAVGAARPRAPPRRSPHRLGEQHAGVRLAPQDRADRVGDVAGRQRRRRDLVEERLEEVVVAAIDDGDLDRRARERARGGRDRRSRRRR